MKGRKNDFSMSFFYNDTRLLFQQYVHNTDKMVQWFNEKINKKWTHAVIFDRRNNLTIEKFTNPSYCFNYAILVFNDTERLGYLEFVDDMQEADSYIRVKYHSWTHYIIYDRNTRQKVGTVLFK